MRGHKQMIIWGNIEKVEFLIFDRIIPSIPNNYFSLRDQIERATTSISANFVEGYYAGSIKEYIRFLGYSRRSLAELNNWGRHINYKKFIDKQLFDEFEDLAMKTMYLFNRLIYSLKNKK